MWYIIVWVEESINIRNYLPILKACFMHCFRNNALWIGTNKEANNLRNSDLNILPAMLPREHFYHIRQAFQQLEIRTAHDHNPIYVLHTHWNMLFLYHDSSCEAIIVSLMSGMAKKWLFSTYKTARFVSISILLCDYLFAIVSFATIIILHGRSICVFESRSISHDETR